ncbi:MAG: molybdenum cofactor biosynthesis protein MoaE, partial [Rhodopirellula sp. JB055]
MPNNATTDEIFDAVNVRLTNEPLEPMVHSLSRQPPWLSHPDAGAILWFHGVTRRKTTKDNRETITKELSYTAHH